MVIDKDVELAPSAPPVGPVEPDLPLTLAVELHARGVHRQVQRPLTRARQLHFERRGPARERRVVRGGQARAEQPEHGADEPLRRAQRQVVDLAQRQRASDREIGVGAAAAAARGPRLIAPLVDGALLDPEGKASAPDEC